MKTENLALLFGLILASCSLIPAAHTAIRPSAKGQWGRVVPIADNAHPNLYYNQSEINELRNMILVQHSPAHLYDLYMNRFRNKIAVQTDGKTGNPHGRNMEAAISYMIEPTAAKADAIKASLLSFVTNAPTGLGTWYNTPGRFFAGYSLPWMYDLLLAYNPERLSATDRTTLKAWFLKSATNLKFETRTVYLNNDRTVNSGTTREGKAMMPFPNWYSRFMGPSLACALLSGDQAAIDYWADSGWPHGLFTTPSDIATYGLPATVNRYDLVMYLLSTYASGANSDSYDREGFTVSDHSWYTTSYVATDVNHSDGGSYHFAHQAGAIFGAEMAYHNGMAKVFSITDAGSEPALLRTYKRALESRDESDRRPTSLSGHPFIGWDLIIWMGYRRYNDPVIEEAVSSLGGKGNYGVEFAPEIYVFFGYPRHVTWSSGGDSSRRRVSAASEVR